MPDIGGLAIDRRVEPVRVQGLGAHHAAVHLLNLRAVEVALLADFSLVAARTNK